MNILLIEDDIKLMNELKTFLEHNNYKVTTLDTFENTVDKILSSKADLILLDINIPYLNGQLVCKEVKKESNIPIIIVTSKNTEIDELISLNYGADDFITKPYNTQILLARIERILKSSNKSTLTYKDLIVDIQKSNMSKNNKTIDLTRNEIKILTHLLNNQGTIISRDKLINYLWDNDEFIDDNTLTVNINRLRNKLSKIGYKDLITTKRGQGYII
ncbi:MAG: response regulator transcription factor [Bacilli bacterium]|nr:response regulator transcription factor [Bacilli bacterium]